MDLSHPKGKMGPPKETAPLLSERKMSLRRYGKPEPIQITGKKAEPGPSRLRESHEFNRVRPEEGCKITAESFKALLRERSGVKRSAGERRLEGMKLIAGMRSRTGVSPLEIFPKEIWAEILKLLPPGDRASMFLLHDVFRDLMESTQIQNIQFPLVLDQKMPLVKFLNHKYDFFDHIKDEHVFKLDSILALRLVSRSLRDCVDRWIEDHILTLMRNLKGSEESLSIPHWSISEESLNSVHLRISDGVEKLQRIRARVADFKQKRFFLRSLRVNLSTTVPSYRQQRSSVAPDASFCLKFKETVSELLEAIGDQIWHFELDCEDADEFLRFCGMPLSQEGLLQVLREWLLLLPNLKWLRLVDEFEEETLLPVEVTQRPTPMPSLRNLERIDFTFCDDISIWKDVLSANTHAKYYFRGHRQGWTNVKMYDHPSVLALSLETVILGGRNMRHCDLQLLQKFSNNSNWKLKKLEAWMDGKSGPISIDAVFRCIEKFQTLEDVALHIDHVVIGEEINFLRLPNLKNFRMEFGPVVRSSGERDFFFSLQFLLHCDKLERLSWENLMADSRPLRRRMVAGVGVQEGIMIDFKGGNVDLSSCNVWNVFPKLRCIKVKFREGAGLNGKKYFRRQFEDGKLVSQNGSRWEPFFF